MKFNKFIKEVLQFDDEDYNDYDYEELEQDFNDNQEKKFGINQISGGWNKKDLHELINWMESVKELQYDILNCKRGEYCPDLGNTLKDLIKKLEDLKDDLNQIIEKYKTHI